MKAGILKQIVLQHQCISIFSCSFKYIMSIKGNLSIFLHLNTFHNVALPHKARYALTANLYQTNSSSHNSLQTIALPFNIIETNCKPKNTVSKESAIDNNYFRSKRFNIQYQDEQIELNDCCQFKMSIESFPQLNTQNIFLQFRLLENPLCYFKEDMEEDVEMKEVEKYRFRLQNIQSGIFKYYQGQFCKSFISKFSFTILLMITDYSFYPRVSTKQPDSNRQKQREKVQNLKDLMIWGQKYIKQCHNAGQFFYKKYVKNLLYNSFCFRAQINHALKHPEELKLFVPVGQDRKLQQVNQKDFFHFITNDYPENLSDEIIRKDIHRINENNFYFLQQYISHIKSQEINQAFLISSYRKQRNDLFGERLMRSIVFGKEPNQKQKNGKIASKMRKKKIMSQNQIIDEHLFVKKENQHYAFLQVNLPYSLKTKQYEQNPFEQVVKEISQLRKEEIKFKQDYHQRNMVIIFCHGFQASSYDMEMLKRQIGKMMPIAFTYSSTINQMNTETDISVLGLKLADQISTFLKKNFQDPTDAILNFVGHSMGGIISRASLTHLLKSNYQFGFYFSLSTPHLGYLNGVDTMIRAGLWFMRKMNKIQSLDQLVMEDSEILRQSFLYKLSQTGNLRCFRKIILLSSSEDSYVPWHSARICYNNQNNSRTKLQKEMINSILGDKIVHRIDIHFNINSTKDLDSFIGRAAHIHLLTQQCIMKLINQSIPNLFDVQAV